MPRPPAKAHSLADALAERIANGDFEAGAWLPSERELAHEYSADRSTVRRALRMLGERGVITVASGTGAQIKPGDALRRAADDVTHQVGTWRGFHVSATKAGHEAYTETTVTEVIADLTVAQGLGVPTGTPVLQRARRQGIVGDGCVQLSTSYIRQELVEELPILRQVDTGPGGMYSRMEEIGYRLHFEETVTCRLPYKDEQERLEITATEPVLVLWRRCYDQHGRILDLTHRVVVGDRQELVYRYDSTT
jgi:GntR family transcriptional regulator